MIQNNYAGALQKLIGSGFNATSTTSDVINGINLKGKIAIITGGGVYLQHVYIAEKPSNHPKWCKTLFFG